ncbi:MAG: AAA family ATPase [Nanoarchaeota archaeon]
MSKLLLVISGTPGTGKAALAKELAKKLGFLRLDLHDYYPKIAIKYNRAKQCYDLNLKKFEKLVREKKKEAMGGLVIDSHVAHLLPKKIVDLCVILTCSNLKKLENKLRQRKYSKKKIRENLDAEIFQVCLMEANEQGHKVLVFDVCKDKNIVKKIKRLLKH